jgi:hypothetical protein
MPSLFPHRAFNQGKFENLIQHGILEGFAPAAPLLSATTPVATVGSCFAQNVAKYLGTLNYNVMTFNITDRLFSPLALAEFFGNLNKDVSVYQKHWEITLDIVEALRERLSRGAVVIVTFGMSAIWTDRATGTYIFDPTTKLRKQADILFVRPDPQKFEMVQTSVDENVKAITSLIGSIKDLNPANKIILTLSPLPLLYSSHRPVVVADTLSKSTLSLAIHQIMRAKPTDVHYFPSFELLKWLAPMVDSIWFEDDLSSHIRNEWIAYTMGVFSEHFCTDKLPKVLPVTTFPGNAAAATPQ